MKKKTIITSLALLAAAAMVGVGTSVGLTAIDTPDQVAAVETDEEGYLLINNKDDLLAVFDGNATYYQSNIRLAADIDMGGHVFQKGYGMAGAYSGIFDGNGHKIYNLATTNGNRIFTEVAGTIKNLTVEYVDSDPGEIRAAYFFANGYASSATIENVHMVYSFFDGGVYSSGLFGFSAAAGSTFKNCSTHVIGNGDMADLSALVWANPVDLNVTNCIKTIDWIGTGTIGSGFNAFGESFTTTKETSYIFLSQKTLDVAVGDSVDVSAITCGAEYTGVNWEAEGQNVEISNGTGSGFTLTALEPGDATVVGTYTTASGTTTAEVTVRVSEAAQVTGVHLEDENLPTTIEEQSSIEINAELEGNIYDSVTWESSDPEAVKVEAAEDDPLSATITAIEPTDEPVTITIKIVSGENTYTDTYELTVSEARGFYVNTIINTSNAEDSLKIPGIYVYGGDAAGGTNFKSNVLSLTKDGTRATINYAGAEQYIFRTFVQLNKAGLDTSAVGVFLQYSYGETGANRIGAGIEYTSKFNETDDWQDVTVTFNENGDGLVYLGDEYDQAIAYLFETVAPNWRDDDNSMCHLLSESDALTAIDDGYTALSPEAKAVLDSVNDGENNSVGNTINYIYANSKIDPTTGSRVALTNDSEKIGLSAILTMAVITMAGAAIATYFTVKKKSAKTK